MDVDSKSGDLLILSSPLWPTGNGQGKGKIMGKLYCFLSFLR